MSSISRARISYVATFYTATKADRIDLEGQPVFLCCSGCEDDARADSKKTLDQVAQFKKGLK